MHCNAFTTPRWVADLFPCLNAAQPCRPLAPIGKHVASEVTLGGSCSLPSVAPPAWQFVEV